MPTVQTRDEWLIRLEKPRLEAVSSASLRDGDWLVLCAGFEDRTRAFLDTAVLGGCHCRVLLVRYQPDLHENKAEEIRSYCEARSLRFVEMVYDREAPAGFGDAVVAALSSEAGRVFVDVSAMSRLLIVQILVALSERAIGLADSFVIYAQAKHYSPTREAAERELARAEDPTFAVLFLSAGILDITVVPELASIAPPGPQSRLIAFPSLDSHQLTALRSELQPSRLTLIEGLPPSGELRWRREVIAKVNRLDEIAGAERLEASTLDYIDTLSLLLACYRRYSRREQLLLAPTGSKMQAVAVGILRCFLRDVQIVYPTPLAFLRPDSYTTGVGRMHCLPLEAFAGRQLTFLPEGTPSAA